MKVVAGIICICTFSLFLGSGCSEEEHPPIPEKKVLVKMPIPARPMIEPAPLDAEPDPEEQAPVPMETVALTEGISPEEELVDEKEDVEPDPEEQAPVPMETVALTEGVSHEEELVDEGKEIEPEEEDGYYLVRKGDTLSGISLEAELYGNPLKWPLLYRLNRESLEGIGTDEGLPDRELPEGIRLKMITTDEVEENLKKRSGKRWVLNILSAISNKRIVPVAVKLIREDYPIYITMARVNDKDWMRIRAGFYGTKRGADRDRERVRDLLNIPDIWTAKIDEKEFEDFGRY